MIKIGQGGCFLTEKGKSIVSYDFRSKLEDVPYAYPYHPNFKPAEWAVLSKAYGSGIFVPSMGYVASLEPARDGTDIETIKGLCKFELWSEHIKRLVRRRLCTFDGERIHLTRIGARVLAPNLVGQHSAWHTAAIRHVSAYFREFGWHTLQCFDRPAVSNPDIVITPKLNWGRWKIENQFVCEIETNPRKHPNLVRENFKRDIERGWPVLFVVLKWMDVLAVERALKKEGAKLVATFNGLESVAEKLDREPPVECQLYKPVSHDHDPFWGLRANLKADGESLKHFAVATLREVDRYDFPRRLLDIHYRGRRLLIYCKHSMERGSAFTVKTIRGRTYLYRRCLIKGKRRLLYEGPISQQDKRALENAGVLKKR
jgi:hypothetical protein